MGFWADSRNFVSAAGGVLNEGMSLLAHGASELEKAAHRLNLETAIMAQEMQRKRLGEAWFDSSNSEKNEKLLSTYAELIEIFPEISVSHAKQSLAKLQSDRRALSFKKQRESAFSFNEQVKTANYRLPIDAISARKRLISMYYDLLSLGSKEENTYLFSQTTARIKELNEEIVELEPRRRTIELTRYDSGVKKMLIQRFDGKLDGVSEEWYESGTLRWRIPYQSNEIAGKVECFREDGSRLMNASLDRDHQTFQLYNSDVEPIATAIKFKAYSSFSVKIPGIGDVKFSKKPSKLSLFLKLLVSPLLLRFMLRANKPGPEAKWVKMFNETLEQCESAMNELNSFLGKSRPILRT